MPFPSTALETRHWYTVSDEIASGGMASIHLGLRTSPHGLSRIVAIKQLHPMYAQNREFVEMFRDEVRVASRVIHPNVVPIVDVVTASEQFFLVMEYVHGLSVSHLQKAVGAAISPAIAATVIVGVLHGLHAAHEARSEKGDPLRIIHRDVTPQNVVVGVDGTPRVLDFGIAHALGRMQTTRIGQLKGKLAYMAPEQLDDLPLDRRVDIYSATVMFWEMLTGRKLFSGRQSDRISQLNLGHVVEAPSLFQRGIPGALDDIVLKGLQPAPDGRYATAREMAIALEDNVDLVSASQLGDWVKQMWGAALEERVLQLMSIERADEAGDVEPATVSEPSPLVRREAEMFTAPGAGHSGGGNPEAANDVRSDVADAAEHGDSREEERHEEVTASTVRMTVPNLIRVKPQLPNLFPLPAAPATRQKWRMMLQLPTAPRVWKTIDSIAAVVMGGCVALFIVAAARYSTLANAGAPVHMARPSNAGASSAFAPASAPVPASSPALPPVVADAPAATTTHAPASRDDVTAPLPSKGEGVTSPPVAAREDKVRRRKVSLGRANGRPAAASSGGRPLHGRRSGVTGGADPTVSTPVTTARKPSASAATESCDPPFFVDSAGIKHFKLTCL